MAGYAHMVVYPIQERVRFYHNAGKLIPASQVTVEQVDGVGQGQMMAAMAKAGGRDEAEGDAPLGGRLIEFSIGGRARLDSGRSQIEPETAQLQSRWRVG